MLFHAYPANLPVDAAMYLAPVLRGRAPEDRNTAINAAYAILSYGLGQVVPVEDGADVLSVMSLEDAAVYVEAMFAPPGVAARAVPWNVLLPILFELIEKLVNKR